MRYITYILALLLLTACSSTEEFFQSDDSGRTPLTLCSVQTEQQVRSRAVIEGSAFSGSATLGLSLTASDGTSDYDSKTSGYDNISYSTTDGTTWTASSAIMLSSTDGTLYAYYPYGNSNTTSIAVSASVNGTDYMYATPQTVNDHIKVGSAYGSVNLNMNHALARIDLTLKKGSSYYKAANLTTLKLSGDGIATSGTLNIKDGSVTATATAFEPTITATNLTTTGTTYKCLIVPASTSAQTATLTCTIDGTAYKTSLGSLTLTKGNYYKAEITLNGSDTESELTVSSVTIGSWTSSATTPTTMREYVEIGGLKWATMNIGATTVADSPGTSYGDYFAFGETEPYYSSLTWVGDTPTFTWGKTTGNGNNAEKTGYDWSNYCGNSSFTAWSTEPYGADGILTSQFDAATVQWGGSWRIPTYSDFQSLVNACGGGTPTTLTTSDPSQGIYWNSSQSYGYLVPGTLFVDANKNKVFFPAAGCVYNSGTMYWGPSNCTGTTKDGNRRCYYTESNVYNTQGIYYFCTGPTFTLYNNTDNDRYYGYPVRPVSE